QAGSISVRGASVTTGGFYARGGAALGTTGNGGTGGAVSVLATSGGVTFSSYGNSPSVWTRGGNAAGAGSGGAGGAVTIGGYGVTLSGSILSNGGNVTGPGATGSGGKGGAVSLVATSGAGGFNRSPGTDAIFTGGGNVTGSGSGGSGGAIFMEAANITV